MVSVASPSRENGVLTGPNLQATRSSATPSSPRTIPSSSSTSAAGRVMSSPFVEMLSTILRRSTSRAYALLFPASTALKSRFHRLQGYDFALLADPISAQTAELVDLVSPVDRRLLQDLQGVFWAFVKKHCASLIRRKLASGSNLPSRRHRRPSRLDSRHRLPALLPHPASRPADAPALLQDVQGCHGAGSGRLSLRSATSRLHPRRLLSFLGFFVFGCSEYLSASVVGSMYSLF